MPLVYRPHALALSSWWGAASTGAAAITRELKSLCLQTPDLDAAFTSPLPPLVV